MDATLEKASEVAVWVTERATQVLGGVGYTREFPVERSPIVSRALTGVDLV
jgi:alkylation response protein AidB-like acyl-CoA dehydrogenase